MSKPFITHVNIPSFFLEALSIDTSPIHFKQQVQSLLDVPEASLFELSTQKVYQLITEKFSYENEDCEPLITHFFQERLHREVMNEEHIVDYKVTHKQKETPQEVVELDPFIMVNTNEPTYIQSLIDNDDLLALLIWCSSAHTTSESVHCFLDMLVNTNVRSCLLVLPVLLESHGGVVLEVLIQEAPDGFLSWASLAENTAMLEMVIDDINISEHHEKIVELLSKVVSSSIHFKNYQTLMLCLTQVHVHSFINQKQLNAILYFLERIPSDNRLDGIVTKLEKGVDFKRLTFWQLLKLKELVSLSCFINEIIENIPVDHEVEIQDESGEYEISLLHAFVIANIFKKEKIAIIRRLLERGSSPNVCRKRIPLRYYVEACYSALTRAISSNQYEIVRIFIDGCDMSASSSFTEDYISNLIPFRIAIENGEYEIAIRLCLKDLMVTKSYYYFDAPSLHDLEQLLYMRQYFLIDILIKQQYISVLDILNDTTFFFMIRERNNLLLIKVKGVELKFVIRQDNESFKAVTSCREIITKLIVLWIEQLPSYISDSDFLKSLLGCAVHDKNYDLISCLYKLSDEGFEISKADISSIMLDELYRNFNDVTFTLNFKGDFGGRGINSTYDIKKLLQLTRCKSVSRWNVRRILNYSFLSPKNINEFFIYMVKKVDFRIVYFIPDFVRLGIDLNQHVALDNFGNRVTPLFMYVSQLRTLKNSMEHKALNVIETLIYFGADPNVPSYIFQGADKKELRTPLVNAILIEHMDCVKILLLNGANIDLNSYEEQILIPALHIAFNKGNKYIQILIEHGAKIGVTDNRGNSIVDRLLTCCESYDYLEEQFLIILQNSSSMSEVKSKKSTSQLISFLLKHHCSRSICYMINRQLIDINSNDSEILFLAIKYENLYVINCLFNNEVILCVNSVFEMHPLAYAIELDKRLISIAIIDFISKHGNKSSLIFDINKKHPLYLLRKKKDMLIEQKLLEAYSSLRAPHQFEQIREFEKGKCKPCTNEWVQELSTANGFIVNQHAEWSDVDTEYADEIELGDRANQQTEPKAGVTDERVDLQHSHERDEPHQELEAHGPKEN